MKIFLIFLIVILVGCSQENSQLSQFSDYCLPLDEFTKERIFVYKKISSSINENTYSYKSISELNGQVVVISTQKSDKIKYDSTITNPAFPFKIIKSFRFDYDSLNNYIGFTEGKVKKDELTSNSAHSIIEYEKDNIQMIIDFELEYKIDSVYIWNGKTIDAIYFETTFHFEVEHKYIPFIGEELNEPGYSIYAKNIGLVKYGSLIDGKITEWELIEIK